jgi:hypothetical protein
MVETVAGAGMMRPPDPRTSARTSGSQAHREPLSRYTHPATT